MVGVLTVPLKGYGYSSRCVCARCRAYGQSPNMLLGSQANGSSILKSSVLNIYTLSLCRCSASPRLGVSFRSRFPPMSEADLFNFRRLPQVSPIPESRPSTLAHTLTLGPSTNLRAIKALFGLKCPKFLTGTIIEEGPKMVKIE